MVGFHRSIARSSIARSDSPPASCADVKAVAGEAVVDAVAPKARKAYNLDQMTAVDGPDGTKVRPPPLSLRCLSRLRARG